MSREKFDLDALKAANFKTNDRRHLAKAHNIMLGYDPEDDEPLETIRLRIVDVVKLDGMQKAEQAKAAALGVSVAEMKESDEIDPVSTNGAVTDRIAQLRAELAVLEGRTIPKASGNVTPITQGSKPLALAKLPNLTGNGRWDGRMRRVTYIKSDPNSSEDVVTPRWEMVKQDCITGQPTDLIWPLYQNLIAAVDLKLEKDFEYEKTGKWKGRLIVNERTISTPKFTIIDHGDVPGTEDKPCDYDEYFKMVARETCVFSGVTRALLMKVHAIMFGVVPITEMSVVSDQDLRLKIAVRMGPEFEDMMSAELFGSAASA